MPLQHLDLIAVGIFEEEKACEELTVALEVLKRGWAEAKRHESRVSCGDIIDGEGEVPLAVAMAVKLGAAFVKSKLKLEFVFRRAKID